MILLLLLFLKLAHSIVIIVLNSIVSFIFIKNGYTMRRTLPVSERIFWITITIILSMVLFFIASNKRISANNSKKHIALFERVYHMILDQYVEVFDAEKLIIGAAKGMIQVLDDPHTSLLPPQDYQTLIDQTTGEYEGLGISIEITDGKYLTVISPFEGAPAWKVGLQAGDRIVKVNGTNVIGISIDEAVKTLRGKRGTQVQLTIDRPGKDTTFDVLITRDRIDLPTVETDTITSNIGYIRIRTFAANSQSQLLHGITDLRKKGINRIIVDVRNDPGGRLDVAINLADEFLTNGIIVYTEGRRGIDNKKYYAHPSASCAKQPMVVLINRGSASASEIFAGAMQDHHRAVIIGEKSFGKGSVQSVEALPDNYHIRITTAYYYTPAGQRIHKIGLTPDITIPWPQQTKHEQDEIHKIQSDTAFSNFMATYSNNYTDKDYRSLTATLHDAGYDFTDYSLKAAIYNAAMTGKKRPMTLPLQLDPQLRQAVELLNVYPSINNGKGQ